MRLRRRTWVLLVLAVMASSAATYALRPAGTASLPCGIGDITLAVEVCPSREVAGLLGPVGSPMREQLRDQTLVDFALVASYVGLWGATGLALNPGVAVIAVTAGAADVVENLAIIHGLAEPELPPAIRWAARAKWGLLGLAFVCFVFLFRPDRVSGGPVAVVRAATGLAYGAAGVTALAGLVDVRSLAWTSYPLMAAVGLQLALHVLAHREFEAARDLRRAARASSAPSLT